MMIFINDDFQQVLPKNLKHLHCQGPKFQELTILAAELLSPASLLKPPFKFRLPPPPPQKRKTTKKTLKYSYVPRFDSSSSPRSFPCTNQQRLWLLHNSRHYKLFLILFEAMDLFGVCAQLPS